MTDTGSKRAGETSTVEIEGCKHFIGKTHGKEGVQVPSQSKQKDLERLVEVISPLHVAIDYASFLLHVGMQNLQLPAVPSLAPPDPFP